MKVLWTGLLLMVADVALAASVASFDDIQYWVGSGSNQAAIVFDWDGDSSGDQSLAWGYRWDGTATGEDMFRAVVTTDSRLFAKVEDYGGSLGIALYGAGYDKNNDGAFGLTDGTIFDSTGLAPVAGAADGATALDPGDLYAEGWFLGFWHYGVSTGNPFEDGSWSSSQWGMTSRHLNDGDWDSWAFTPTFNFEAYAENPVAAAPPGVEAVPEPATIILLAAVLPLLLFRLGAWPTAIRALRAWQEKVWARGVTHP